MLLDTPYSVLRTRLSPFTAGFLPAKDALKGADSVMERSFDRPIQFAGPPPCRSQDMHGCTPSSGSPCGLPPGGSARPFWLGGLFAFLLKDHLELVLPAARLRRCPVSSQRSSFPCGTPCWKTDYCYLAYFAMLTLVFFGDSGSSTPIHLGAAEEIPALIGQYWNTINGVLFGLTLVYIGLSCFRESLPRPPHLENRAGRRSARHPPAGRGIAELHHLFQCPGHRAPRPPRTLRRRFLKLDKMMFLGRSPCLDYVVQGQRLPDPDGTELLFFLLLHRFRLDGHVSAGRRQAL